MKDNKITTYTNIFSIYLTYFCDLFSFSLVVVVVAELLIPKTSTLLPTSLPITDRNIITGLLIATYPIAQLFGAPFLGGLSDMYGRKKILLITTLLSAISFSWAAISISTNNIHLLFISRLLGGFAAGNATISQAAIADLTNMSKRGKYMAIFPVTGGLAWILAPYLGGILSDSNYISWFNPALPFWFITVLFLVCFLLINFVLDDHNQPLPVIHLNQSLSLGLLTQYKQRKIVIPILLLLSSFFSWFFFISYFSTYLLEKFDFNDIKIDKTFVFLSLCYTIGGLIANLWLTKKYPTKNLSTMALFIVGISLLYIAFSHTTNYFYIALITCGVFQAIAVSCLFTICSKLAGEDLQGKIFGTINAIIALCFVITPPISGWLANYNLNLPIRVGGILLLCTALLYFLSIWIYRILPQKYQ